MAGPKASFIRRFHWWTSLPAVVWWRIIQNVISMFYDSMSCIHDTFGTVMFLPEPLWHCLDSSSHVVDLMLWKCTLHGIFFFLCADNVDHVLHTASIRMNSPSPNYSNLFSAQNHYSLVTFSLFIVVACWYFPLNWRTRLGPVILSCASSFGTWCGVCSYRYFVGRFVDSWSDFH